MARKKNKFLRKLNPPPGTVPLVVGAIAVGLTAGGILLFATPAKASSKKKKNECKPYKFVSAEVRASIEAEIDAGERDPAKIAVDVATEHFGLHPDGGTVTFPPDPSNARKGVVCVWNKTVVLVGKIFEERGISPDDGSEGVEIIELDPYDEGYPWEDAALEKNNYPTPGMFADVGADSDFDYSRGPLAMGAAVINSALAMAAAKGIDVSEAQSIMAKDAAKSAKKRDLQKQMMNEIACSKWNDALYGVTVPKSEEKSAKNWFGWTKNKRHLLYLPQHNDVLALMSVGERPRRAITATGSHKSGNNRRQPVFWIPAINLERLGGPKPVVTTAGMKWSDGSSTREPPPIVSRLGVDPNGVSLPGGFGCK